MDAIASGLTFVRLTTTSTPATARTIETIAAARAAVQTLVFDCIAARTPFQGLKLLASLPAFFAQPACAPVVTSIREWRPLGAHPLHVLRISAPTTHFLTLL